jgi:sialic acid synthase SpsE
MKTIKINGRAVGEGQPVFVIAEAGVNHNGDFDAAYKMVKVAKDAGADAVTFQHIVAEKLNSKKVKSKFTNADWNKWELSAPQLKKLCDYARSLELQYSICVIDEKSLDLVVSYGISFIKIVSGDLTDLPFLKYCARTKLPIFMSTGGSTIDEVKDAVHAIESEGNHSIVLYHTNSSYPTPPNEVNLRILETLNNEFDYPAGFCDHTVEVMTSVIAAARGACVIEKHFTLDRNKKAPDFEVSLEPSELKQMIHEIRFIEQVLGTPERRLLECERECIKLSRRSIASRTRIPAGSVITEKMLAFRRPGTGIQPKDADKIIGKKAKIDIDENVLIEMHALSE